MVINLNPATSAQTHTSLAGNGNSNNNIIGIVSHAEYDGIVYLQVICPGDEVAKWVTVEEAMDYCPSGVIAYTRLQLYHIYGVPMDWLFHSN